MYTPVIKTEKKEVLRKKVDPSITPITSLFVIEYIIGSFYLVSFTARFTTIGL